MFFSPVPGSDCSDPASLREVSSFRFPPRLLTSLGLSTLSCLSRSVTLLPPLSPFGPVLALLLFPSLGRFQLQYSPSHGSLATHCCVANQPAQDLLEGFDGRLFVVSCYGFQLSRSLRSPYGFQCFPVGIVQGAENSFLPIDPCSCERCFLCSNTNVGAYFEPSSNTRSQDYPPHRNVVSFSCGSTC